MGQDSIPIIQGLDPEALPDVPSPYLLGVKSSRSSPEFLDHLHDDRRLSHTGPTGQENLFHKGFQEVRRYEALEAEPSNEYYHIGGETTMKKTNYRLPGLIREKYRTQFEFARAIGLILSKVDRIVNSPLK